jgi:hypothetical protein
MTQAPVFRGLTYSIVFSLVLLLGFGVVLAENNNNNNNSDKDKEKSSVSSIKKEDREEWKIPGGEPRVEIAPSGNVLVRGAKIVRIKLTDPVDGIVYDETTNLNNNGNINNWYNYFFNVVTRRTAITLTDLPAYGAGTIEITITNTGFTAKCGVCILGAVQYVGEREARLQYKCICQAIF